jgi:mono/diheme cytochrome c family protein/rhodanese-related sulfurtransferase
MSLLCSGWRPSRRLGWSAILCGLVACARSGPPGAPAVARVDPASPAQDPAALYARYCALCHGADREGYAADEAPSLRSPELMGAASGAFLWNAIAFGRPGTAMAAFAESQGGPLSHDAQHLLLDWLVKQSGAVSAPLPDAAVEGDADRGATIYASHCAGCHGHRGQGGVGTALANPVFLATASDAFLAHTVTEGRRGTPMPAFRDSLAPDAIRDVVAFLRSRAVGWDAPEPVRVRPPAPTDAIQNPGAPGARLQHRHERFVSAASVAAALERGERLVLLDARPLSDWQRSHIPGALPVPFYDGVEAIVPHLPRDGTPIVAYCACPHAASGKVVDALRAQGFTEARILDEGVLHWAGEGYPLQLGGSE